MRLRAHRNTPRRIGFENSQSRELAETGKRGCSDNDCVRHIDMTCTADRPGDSLESGTFGQATLGRKFVTMVRVVGGVLLLVWIASIAPSRSLDNGVALTPPMGWLRRATPPPHPTHL